MLTIVSSSIVSRFCQSYNHSRPLLLYIFLLSTDKDKNEVPILECQLVFTSKKPSETSNEQILNYLTRRRRPEENGHHSYYPRAAPIPSTPNPQPLNPPQTKQLWGENVCCLGRGIPHGVSLACTSPRWTSFTDICVSCISQPCCRVYEIYLKVLLTMCGTEVEINDRFLRFKAWSFSFFCYKGSIVPFLPFPSFQGPSIIQILMVVMIIIMMLMITHNNKKTRYQ